jgi:hypothetical protein
MWEIDGKNIIMDNLNKEVRQSWRAEEVCKTFV